MARPWNVPRKRRPPKASRQFFGAMLWMVVAGASPSVASRSYPPVWRKADHLTGILQSFEALRKSRSNPSSSRGRHVSDIPVSREHDWLLSERSPKRQTSTWQSRKRSRICERSPRQQMMRFVILRDVAWLNPRFRRSCGRILRPAGPEFPPDFAHAQTAK